MTYNLLWGGIGREALIREVIGSICPQIAVFTEVTDGDSFNAIADAVGSYRVKSRCGLYGERTAIVSCWPILGSQPFGPRCGRRKWIEATIQPSGGSQLRIHAVHLVAHSMWPMELWRKQEVRSMLGHVRTRSDTPHIIAGDFNTLADGDALALLRVASFVDCYRKCHPSGEGFTVTAWNPTARLDYIFASEEMGQRLRSSDVRASSVSSPLPPPPRRSYSQMLGWKPTPSLGGYASDHFPVWTDFEWPVS